MRTCFRSTLLGPLLVLLSAPVVLAQQWMDPADADPCPVQRRLTTDAGLYERAGKGSGSGGLLVEFYTTSPTIRVRITADGAISSGIDLFATECDGVTRPCRETMVAGDLITFTKPKTKSTHKYGDRCRLYLPLGVTVTSLQVGVDEGAYFDWLPDRVERPILVCLPSERGVSPAETRAARLERELDIPVIAVPEGMSKEEMMKSRPRLILTGEAKDLASEAREALGLPTKWVCPPVTQSRDRASYAWERRHNEVILRNRTAKPSVLVLGNSIMHYWSGLPASQHHRGDDSWSKLFGDRVVTNMGFGWDRIENLNWRLTHGELDDCDPEVILLAIGTNNLSSGDDNRHIALGIAETATLLRRMKPKAQLYVLGVLPRKDMMSRIRPLNMLTESLISVIPGATFIDVSEGLTEDGKLIDTLFRDGLHPNADGYRILGDNIARQVDL